MIRGGVLVLAVLAGCAPRVFVRSIAIRGDDLVVVKCTLGANVGDEPSTCFEETHALPKPLERSAAP